MYCCLVAHGAGGLLHELSVAHLPVHLHVRVLQTAAGMSFRVKLIFWLVCS